MIDISIVFLLIVDMSGILLNPEDKGMPDSLQVTITQVAPQLFHAPSYLDPRVSPCHDAVDTLFVFHILDDILRMTQGKAIS